MSQFDGLDRLQVFLADEAATDRFGAALAALLPPGATIHLLGPIGAGKSALTRAALRALGVSGAIRSPTYTLIESYATEKGAVHHLDLYRLGEAEELYYLGFDDLLDGQSRLFIEWPERAEGLLPAPWLTLSLSVCHSGRELQILHNFELEPIVEKLLGDFDKSALFCSYQSES